jgi:hypothetical protein
MPKLKKRAWAENRGESGNNRSANGSSKDSSTSRCVKELSGLSGELFQSNSIKSRFVTQSPMQCPYNVFTHGRFRLSNYFSQFDRKSRPPGLNSGGRSLKDLKNRHSLPPPLSPPTLFINEISGINIAMTMLPTTTARNTIMMGSSNEVMAATALSTSSS